MKRLHIHLAVDNLDESIRFYSLLFATAPSVVKHDYAKWMLDDPRINFAVSTRSTTTGLDHLGIQVESAEELREMHARLQNLQGDITAEIGTACCYARSDKYWTTDPQGIAWESFHTLGDIPVFAAGSQRAGACCVPQSQDSASCCAPADTAKGACC